MSLHQRASVHFVNGSICDVTMVTGTVAHSNCPEKPYLLLAWITRPLTSQHMAACNVTTQEGNIWNVMYQLIMTAL